MKNTKSASKGIWEYAKRTKRAVQNGGSRRKMRADAHGLAEPDWEEPSKCPYPPRVNESIRQIKLNLRNGEEMNLEDMLNTITLGNSYELIKNIPNKSIELIIIDPPYEYTTGNGAGCFETKKRTYHKEYYKVAKKTYRQNDDKIKNRKEIEHLSCGIDYKILDELDNVMKKINIYIWCSKHQVEPLLKHYLDKNCNIEILTWHKTNPLPTMNNTYANDTEYCIFARESGVPLNGDYETKRKYYVTNINKTDKEKFKHPTIKPLPIIKNLIINSSNKGDIVLDCFSREWDNLCGC